jgi:hypothetical protein
MPRGFSICNRWLASGSTSDSTLGQPVEQQLVSLAPDRVERQTSRAHNGQHRPYDAPGVLPPERPLVQGRQFLLEECVRVGHVLVERARKNSIQYRPIARPADASQERIDRPNLVACAVELDGGADECSRGLDTGHRIQRRFQDGKRMDDPWRIQRQLQSKVSAGGLADDVGPLDPEYAH